uniref:guanylyl cyclase C-like isoform X2 n=1 Tax=Myxine glutinosa TaxID=7769 RepID=UPI00358E5B26
MSELNVKTVIFGLIVGLGLALYVNETGIAVILIQDKDTDWSMHFVRPAIEEAINEVNENMLNGKGMKLVARYRNYTSLLRTADSYSCEDTDCEGLEAINDMKKNACMILGPSCVSTSYMLLRFESLFNLPILSAGSFSLSTTHYLGLTRMIIPAIKVSEFFSGLWMYTDSIKPSVWRNAYILSDEESDFNVCGWYIQALLDDIDDDNEQPIFKSMASLVNVISIASDDLVQLFDSREGYNVIITCGTSKQSMNIIRKFENYTLHEKLVFFVIDLFSTNIPEFDENDTKLWKQVLIVKLPLPPGLFNETIPNYFAWAYYDSVLAYAQTMLQHEVLCNLNDSLFFNNKTFQGLVGPVYLDSNGNRDMDLEVLLLQDKQVLWTYSTRNKSFNLHSNCTLPWDGGVLPKDHIEKRWEKQAKDALMALIIILFFFVIAFFIIWSKRSLKRSLTQQRWVISWDDLQDLDGEKSQDERLEREKVQRTFERRSSYDSNYSKAAHRRLSKIYNNKSVALERIFVTDKVFSRQQKLELINLLELHFNNLAKVYGTTQDRETEAIYFVQEFCSRGSLQDVLADKVTYPENTLLDWEFKVSIMQDIAKGMLYLHTSKIKVHGHLKSTNCIVNRRMMVKITDFGLPFLREPTDTKRKRSRSIRSDDEEEIVSTKGKISSHFRRRYSRGAHASIESDAENELVDKSQLWVAPELLRKYGVTQKGDVYSFGIILQEIIYRRNVFFIDGETYTEKEIVWFLRERNRKHLRPTLNRVDFESTGGHEIFHMIGDCWDEEPQKRPDFRHIDAILQKVSIHIHRGKTQSYMDNLLRRLNQYSNRMEHLVETRTQMYLKARDRADSLSARLLPPAVVQSLKLNGKVDPELFDDVTIYLSDIVGFTTICKHSEPMEVVSLLNELYQQFDRIADKYDVYKVETIGDAYMVVSGLPKRNGQQHAAEVANTALDILAFVGNFHIPHLPGVPLWLRVGIHTGCCAAGVVGNKMPRYCLFGDSVSIASRMESRGSPCRIHISQATVDALRTLNLGHMVEQRENIKIPGKPLEQTYWLIGREGFFKPLPDPPPVSRTHGLKSEFEKLILQIKEGQAVSEPDLPVSGN